MGLKEPVIGTVIERDTTLTVIGVVADFVYNDPAAPPMPMLLMNGELDNMNTFFVRFENRDNWPQTLAGIESAQKKVNPANPFEFKFAREEYQKSFEEISSTGSLGAGCSVGWRFSFRASACSVCRRSWPSGDARKLASARCWVRRWGRFGIIYRANSCGLLRWRSCWLRRWLAG
jgi:hypothetical protein